MPKPTKKKILKTICCISDCQNEEGVKNDRVITLFPFPHRDKTLKEKWRRFLLEIPHESQDFLCSDHFQKKHLQRDLKSELLYKKPKWNLVKEAFPSIWNNEEDEETGKNNDQVAKNKIIDDIFKEYESKFCAVPNCKNVRQLLPLPPEEGIVYYKKLNIPSTMQKVPLLCPNHMPEELSKKAEKIKKQLEKEKVQNTDEASEMKNNFRNKSVQKLIKTEDNLNFDEISMDESLILIGDNNASNFEISELSNTVESSLLTIKTEDFCRICLKDEEVVLHPLGFFSSIDKKKGVVFHFTSLGRLYEHCTQIKILELPNCLFCCNHCKQRLELVFNLKKQATESRKLLQEKYKNYDWVEKEVRQLKKVKMLELQRSMRNKRDDEERNNKCQVKILPEVTDDTDDNNKLVVFKENNFESEIMNESDDELSENSWWKKYNDNE